jgi:hypothetical protein
MRADAGDGSQGVGGGDLGVERGNAALDPGNGVEMTDKNFDLGGDLGLQLDEVDVPPCSARASRAASFRPLTSVSTKGPECGWLPLAFWAMNRSRVERRAFKTAVGSNQAFMSASESRVRRSGSTASRLGEAQRTRSSSRRLALATGFVAQSGLRSDHPFPRTDLSCALRERRSEGGKAVQDGGPDLKLGHLPVEVA